jgi:ribose transport system permease protein
MSSSDTLPAAVGSDSAERAGPPQAEVRPRRRRPLDYVEAYALLGLLVLVGLFFTFFSKTSDTFLTSANLQVLVAGQVVVAIVALGLLVPLCANEWDLSVGAVAGLAAVFSAVVMSSNGLLLGILVGIGIGVLVGVANALIVTRLNVNAVIATLGMATIVAGAINLKTAGLPVVSDIPESLTNLGSATWLGVPRLGVVLVVVALVVHYVLGYTPYGRYLYALGANPLAARLVGLRTRMLLAMTFVIAGVLAGIGGILAVARAGGADPKLGDQLLLPAFAAAFLSAASIKPGRYNVGGLLVAVYFLAVLNNGLNLAGVRPYVNLFVNGTALIVGVALATYLGRRRRGGAA